ncbi:unnamed protein product [Umbelopsis vinacea]
MDSDWKWILHSGRNVADLICIGRGIPETLIPDLTAAYHSTKTGYEAAYMNDADLKEDLLSSDEHYDTASITGLTTGEHVFLTICYLPPDGDVIAVFITNPPIASPRNNYSAAGSPKPWQSRGKAALDVANPVTQPALLNHIMYLPISDSRFYGTSKHDITVVLYHLYNRQPSPSFFASGPMPSAA